MCEYEFPILATLSRRLNSISEAVDDEEISLYIKRKDVLSASHEIDGNKFDDRLSAIRQRVLKHFSSAGSSDVGELQFVPNLWALIIASLETTLSRVLVASMYFQTRREKVKNNCY